MVSSKHTLFYLTISPLVLLTASSGAGAAGSNHPASFVCGSTLHPDLCKSMLPQTAGTSCNFYDYGRSAVRQSISRSRKFHKLVNSYLRSGSTLSMPAVRALQDCQQLAELNTQFLIDSLVAVNSTNNTLPSMQADDLQTLLSATLTNQQTCLEGLQETASARRVENCLSTPLKNDTELYSVSLALATRAWVPKHKRNSTPRVSKKRLEFLNGRLSISMSNQTRQIYEKVRQAVSTVNNVSVSDIVVVSKDGRWNFTTVNDALDVAPNNTDGRDGYFMIYVKAGVYEEHIEVAKSKKYLMMVGDGINQTILTGNRSVVDGWTTFNSATFVVTASMFLCVNMTVKNTAGAIKHQAVAVRNSADMSTFYRCSFEGYQDTLYTHSLRQFYRECDIYGTVDFIFGNAAVVFQRCNLYARLPMDGQFNAVTAQGRTDPNQNTGTSIHKCTVRAAPDLAASNRTVETYLGRPWKEYSRAVFMQSFLDSLVNKKGFIAWSGDFALNTSFYAEFNNSGPGSLTGDRVKWTAYKVISARDAANFTAGNFLLADAWLPQTGVPYVSGLDVSD